MKDVLGSGACGVVYLGYYSKITNPDKQEMFAIKQIPITTNSVITDTMIREINILRRIDHENIVKFIDAKRAQNFFYMIMEYCNQGSLCDIVNNRNLTEKEILNTFFQVLRAVKYLYDKNIFHRDIKPQNILVKNGVVKLVDFGLSKFIDNL